MKGIKIEISGENKNEEILLQFLREIMNPKFEKKEENLYVLMGQNYSFGTDSDLAITAFFKHENSNYIIEIISSGGGEGIFGFTLGSEKRILNVIKNKIEQFCEEKKLEFVYHEIDI